MTDSKAILTQAHWLPSGFDPATRQFHFINLTRERLSAPRFLADAASEPGLQTAQVPLDDILAAPIEPAPLHFIFHTAFCRSTLLVRALERPGHSVGLSEPGIIARLGGAPPEAVEATVKLLARAWEPGESVFVKPTNHANALIPALLDHASQAKVVLMTNSLASFLKAVARKGMMGRRWARQLYLELMGYAGMDFGMDAREQFSMTDLQAGALAWFLNQAYFTTLAQQLGERVRVVNGDEFAAKPVETLTALGEFTRVDLDQASAKQIVGSPVFTRDAKTGQNYAEKAERDQAATAHDALDTEISQLSEWIAMIAQQTRITAPLAQTLL